MPTDTSAPAIGSSGVERRILGMPSLGLHRSLASQSLSEPQVYERLRQNTSRTRLYLKLSVDFWIYGYAPSALCPYFKFDFVSLIPVIGQTMTIPELADLFQRLGSGNAGQLCIFIFVPNAFVLYYPCLGRSI